MLLEHKSSKYGLSTRYNSRQIKLGGKVYRSIREAVEAEGIGVQIYHYFMRYYKQLTGKDKCTDKDKVEVLNIINKYYKDTGIPNDKTLNYTPKGYYKRNEGIELIPNKAKAEEYLNVIMYADTQFIRSGAIRSHLARGRKPLTVTLQEMFDYALKKNSNKVYYDRNLSKLVYSSKKDLLDKESKRYVPFNEAVNDLAYSNAVKEAYNKLADTVIIVVGVKEYISLYLKEEGTYIGDKKNKKGV